MKITINRKFILEYLNKISRLTSYQGFNFLTPPSMFFEFKNNSFSLKSYDGVVFCKVNIKLSDLKNEEIKINEEGSFLINNRPFLSLIKTIKSDYINFIKTEDSIIVLETESQKIKLNLINEKEFVEIKEVKSENFIVFPVVEFQENLKKVIFAINEKEKRKVLTGVCMFINNNQLTFVATDSYRLAKKEYQITNDFKIGDEISNIIVPFKILNEISKVIVGEEENIKLFFNDKKLTVVIGNLEINTKLIDGKYPNIESVIPKDFKNILKINRQTLINSVKTATVISDDYLSTVVKLTISKKETLLTFSSNEIGDYEERITNDGFEGEAIKIAFNSKYLTDALQVYGCETVEIKMNNSNSSVLVCDETEPSITQLVLPVRMFN